MHKLNKLLEFSLPDSSLENAYLNAIIYLYMQNEGVITYLPSISFGNTTLIRRKRIPQTNFIANRGGFFEHKETETPRISFTAAY